MEKFVVDDTHYSTNLSKKYLMRKKYQPPEPKKILAFIPGNIRAVFVQSGQQIRIGDPLLVLEAMKMKNTVRSHLNARIKSVNVSEGQMVPKDFLMLEFE